MIIEVKRRWFTDKSTIGQMYIDGSFFCYTLEDAVRDKKIHGITAIPEGTYDLILNMSNRFKKEMPLLLNVPNFSGVRIHAGNYPSHTEGCLLVGMTRGVDSIFSSKGAFEALMAKLRPEKEIKISIQSEKSV